MKKTTLLLTLFAFLAIACCKTNNTEKFTIASELGDCIGVAPMKCFFVKKEGKTDWEFMYDSIEGFEYEPGYEYVVEVKKEVIENLPADRSAFKYTLVKIVSRKEKASENLPRR